MSFNGAGVFNRLYSWVQDALNGIPIDSTRMDNETNGIAAGLSNCVTRDGQSPATANLPMGGFRHTNVANGVALTDYATMGQLQSLGLRWGGTAGGTGNAITVNITPAPTAYSAGMSVAFLASAANSGATTIDVNGLGAKNVFRRGAALAGGELAINDLVELTYDGTQFQIPDQAFPASQDLPMVTKKFTQVGDATARDQFSAAGQIQDASLINGSVGGTANAITLTLTPAITSYTAGQLFTFKPTADNSGATTINVSGLGAKSIFAGGVAMVGGEIKNGVPTMIQYDGTQFNVIGASTSSFRANDGSRSAPAYSFTSETSSGWYRNGGLRLSVLNTDKIRVTSTNVDLMGGTTGSEASKLNVQANGFQGTMLSGSPSIAFQGNPASGIGSNPSGAFFMMFNGNYLSLSTGSISPDVNNVFDIGNGTNRFKQIFATNGTINTSDAREKKDIEDLTLGLDFVNALEAKTFRWIVGENRKTEKPGEIVAIPGKRLHAGLIAQQVKEQLDLRGIDIGLWTLGDANDPDSVQALRYDQMVPILVKAVQELTARVAALES